MRFTRYSFLSLFICTAWMAQQRPAIGDSPRFLFGTPSLIEGISTPDEGETAGFLSSDSREFFFSKQTGGGIDWDIYVAGRESQDAPFGQPVPVAELNEPGTVIYDFPRLSADGLTIYYVKNTPGFYGEIWTAGRSSHGEPFGTPSPLFALLPNAAVGSPSVTGDGLSLYAGYRAIPPDSDVDVYVVPRRTKPAVGTA